MQQLRVVMVISSFSPIIGGAERQALQLGQSLATRGVKVQVLTRRYPGLATREEIGQITVHRLPVMGNGRNSPSTLLFMSGVVQWLIRNRHDYDVVHAHLALSPATAALLAKLVTSKPVLVKTAGSGYYGGLAVARRRPLLSWRVRLLRRADRFLVLNEESEHELRRLGMVDEQIARIFNGVDTEYFFPQPNTAQPFNPSTRFVSGHRKLREPQVVIEPPSTGSGTVEMQGATHSTPSESLKAVFVGRLGPEKGLDVLLRAWAQLAEPRELILVGEGTKRAPLEVLASELKLDHVTFTGSTNDVRSYLQQADLFVLPSRSEGIPNAMLEAMACGLPIVASHVGGIPDVVQDGESGLLVPPEDIPALAAAIGRLLADSDLRRQLGEKARQRVVSDYSLNAATTRHLDLYREVIGLPETI